MKRIATSLLAVAAMSAALLTPTNAANAAVSGSDFPTVKQIAEIYPALQGGDRKQFAKKSLKMGTAANKCSGDTVLKARSGMVSEYENPGRSVMSVDVYVLNFASKKEAQRGVNTMRTLQRNCRSFTLDGIKVKVAPVSLPHLGDDRIGATMTMTESGSTDRYVAVMIRKGRKLIVTDVANVSSFNTKKLVRLAKLTYQRAT